jgi:hypothetical protein
LFYYGACRLCIVSRFVTAYVQKQLRQLFYYGKRDALGCCKHILIDIKIVTMDVDFAIARLRGVAIAPAADLLVAPMPPLVRLPLIPPMMPPCHFRTLESNLELSRAISLNI